MSKKGRGRVRKNEWRTVHLVFNGIKEDRNILMPIMSKVIFEKGEYKVVSLADPRYQGVKDYSEPI